jgi:restriction system protein
LAAKESLFDYLKRSPWWLSLAIAIGIAASLQVFLPMAFALFAALPFAVIGGYAAWRQRGTPGQEQAARILEQLRQLNREEFAALVEDAYRRDGYAVSVHESDDADLELKKEGRTTLLAYRRWKTAQTGIDPVRALGEAMRRQEASGGAYIAAGVISETARQYAAAQSIELVEGEGLAKLLARSLKRPN